jgi:hypothetical protein
MPPEAEEAPELASNGDEEKQSIYIVRHGDRWDYENPEVRTAFIILCGRSHTVLLEKHRLVFSFQFSLYPY